MSFEDDGTTTNTVKLIQENSYYAFGMQMTGGYTPATNPNKKLYNAGSEWQDDIDGLADYYSTFYREYDPVIGRFNGVDPMSASFESWTTYHYSYNNPINFNDPMGDLPENPNVALAREMREAYNSWHDGKYGNNFPDRCWDLGGGGNDGSGGSGGSGGAGGTYYSGFGNGDNYFGNNRTSNNAFWRNLWYTATTGEGKGKTFHNRDGEFGYWEDFDVPGGGYSGITVGIRWVIIGGYGGSFGGGGIGIMQTGRNVEQKTKVLDLGGQDFVTLTLGFYVVQGSITLDRFGNLYFGGGGGLTLTTPVSGSITAGNIIDGRNATEKELNDFLSGHSVSWGAGAVFGISGTWSPGNGVYSSSGLYWPQVGVNYSYTPSSWIIHHAIK